MLKDKQAELTKRIETFTDEVVELKGQVKGLRKERDEARDEIALSDQIVRLKKDLVELEIKKDREQENHKREKREVEHMVGLEKKRQQFEIDQAKRETTVQVREENLEADKDRFAEQLKFHEDRFDTEVKYLKDIVEQILERLPTVTIDRTVTNGARAKAAR